MWAWKQHLTSLLFVIIAGLLWDLEVLAGGYARFVDLSVHLTTIRLGLVGYN
jgi:hypothetical protein